MTIQNAIKNLELFPDWNVDDGWLTENEMNELCSMSISALKKQLPKKPVMTEDKQFALCPCCNGKGLLDKQMYCDCCGQRIDWSDAD